MPLLILGLFIAVPIIEIAVFIEIGGEIGLWNTIAVVILTAMVGTWLLRNQGIRTLDRARQSLEQQVFPVAELFDGMCLLVAGALLLTPGFVTDAVGFLLFVPPVRGLLRAWAWSVLQKRGDSRVWVMDEDGRSGTATGPGGTIDGDFREIDPDDNGSDQNRDGSGTPPRLT